MLDCDGTPKRVASSYEPIQNARERILIDHHRTSQPIFEIDSIDPAMPATALIIYELSVALQMPFSREMANGLMTGFSCDTGHFRFLSGARDFTRRRPFARTGGNRSQVAFKLFDERSLNSTRLLGMALGKMQSEASGELRLHRFVTKPIFLPSERVMKFGKRG